MRLSARFLAAAAVLSAGLAAAPSPAAALSCMPPSPPEDAAKDVDLLFEGTAVAQVEEDVTRFRIDAVYLGRAGDYVTIRTPGHPWAFEYEIGQTAAVAAHLHEGAYYAGPCEKVEGGPAALVDWLNSR